jgi:hypothetical protein
MTSNTFAFYEKTLVASNYQKPLLFNSGTTNIS